MVRAVEHDAGVATFGGATALDDVEPAVAQVHRRAPREPADGRCVEHFDADADSSGRTRGGRDASWRRRAVRRDRRRRTPPGRPLRTTASASMTPAVNADRFTGRRSRAGRLGMERLPLAQGPLDPLPDDAPEGGDRNPPAPRRRSPRGARRRRGGPARGSRPCRARDPCAPTRRGPPCASAPPRARRAATRPPAASRAAAAGPWSTGRRHRRIATQAAEVRLRRVTQRVVVATRVAPRRAHVGFDSQVGRPPLEQRGHARDVGATARRHDRPRRQVSRIRGGHTVPAPPGSSRSCARRSSIP